MPVLGAPLDTTSIDHKVGRDEMNAVKAAVNTINTASFAPNATPGAGRVPQADSNGKLAAGWLSEVLSFNDLADNPHTVAAAATGLPITDNLVFSTPTAGQRVWLRAGVYTVNPLTMATPDVRFMAHPLGTTLRLADQGGGASTYSINITAADVFFDGINFDGNSTTIAAGTNNYWSGVATLASGADRTTFRRCTFQNTARGAIYANGYAGAQRISGLTVEECTFTNIGSAGAGNGGAGIMLDGGCNDYVIKRNKANGVLTSNACKITLGELPSNSSTYAVQGGSTTTSIIVNGTPFTPGAMKDVAWVRFYSATNAVLVGQTVPVIANTNNTLTLAYAVSAAVTAGDTVRVWLPCSGGLVDENEFDYRACTTVDATFAALAIEMFNGAWRTRCSRNKVYGPDAVLAAGYFWGISTGDARSSKITENDVFGSAANPSAMGYGIEVAECPSIVLKGNHVRWSNVGSNFTNNNPVPSHSISIEGDVYENCYQYGIVSDSAPSAAKIIGCTLIDCGTRFIWFNSAAIGVVTNGTIKDGIISGTTFQVRDWTRLDSDSSNIWGIYISSNNESDIVRLTIGDCNFGPYPATKGPGDSTTEAVGTVGLHPIRGNKPSGVRIHHSTFDGLAPTGGAKALKAISWASGELHVDHCTYQNFSSSTAALCSLSAAATASLSTFEYNINGGGNGASNTHGISSDANTPFSVTWWDANGHLRNLEWSANGVTAPTAAFGANAGTLPPSPVVNSLSTDRSARVTYGTGTAPAAGEQLVITFHKPFVNVPQPTVSAMNAATQPLGLYVSAISTTSVSIASANAPGISQPNTTYDVVVHLWPT